MREMGTGVANHTPTLAPLMGDPIMGGRAFGGKIAGGPHPLIRCLQARLLAKCDLGWKLLPQGNHVIGYNLRQPWTDPTLFPMARSGGTSEPEPGMVSTG